MVSMWYKLVDKFGTENIFLIFTGTYSLVFGLIGKTCKEADSFSYIIEEPKFAKLFDLDGPRSSSGGWKAQILSYR